MIVLDAAALVDVVLDQPAKSWVLERIAGEEVCAPAHQPAEVLSAVARLIRADELRHEAARAALDEAMALSQELVWPTVTHITKAMELQDRIRVLDGLYVAIAVERACPLVTTDHRLQRAAPPCEVAVPPLDEP